MTSDKKTRFLDATEIERVIAEVRALAKESGIRVALVGGSAMQLLGSDRLTKDIDVIASKALPSGWAPLDELAFGGLQAVTPTGVPVDWIVRDDDYTDLYGEAIDVGASHDASLGILVVKPEYLVAMKMVAGRPKDQEDIFFLLTGDIVDRKAARWMIRRVLGAYAADEFDRYCDEADWRATRGKR